MNKSRPGPSGTKKPKISKKAENSVWNRYSLTEEQLLQYLMDSDDDIKDPDYSESDSEFEDSDDEEPEDICAGDDLNTSSALDFPPVFLLRILSTSNAFCSGTTSSGAFTFCDMGLCRRYSNSYTVF
ncbi:hypothetical protein JTB14_022173 [Gonioctena quinquepunctata]|nr:hypothetical protein JTB14_022173 [Gonioctena quinquepunctata]